MGAANRGQDASLKNHPFVMPAILEAEIKDPRDIRAAAVNDDQGDDGAGDQHGRNNNGKGLLSFISGCVLPALFFFANFIFSHFS
jgi:hypothetical protein